MAYPPYIEIFGGGPVWPSSISYISYNLDTIGQSIILQFPQVATTNYVTAGTINVLTTNLAHTITMPDVTIVSPGYTMWIRNSGAADLTVYKNDGSVLIVINPGLTWFVQVIDNTTPAGQWFVGQFGAGSSSVSAAALAGAGLRVDPVAPTKLATNVIAREFSVGGYTIQQSDRAILLVWTGGTDILNLPDIATLLPGFQCYLSNQSVGGILTVQCIVGQLINKQNFITCNPGSSFEIVIGPLEYYTVGSLQFSFNDFHFPDGSIGHPSINFVTDNSSGFSHQYVNPGTQALNFSLAGVLQASFATIGSVSAATFPNIVQSLTGYYVFGNNIAYSRIVLNSVGPENVMNFYAYNVGGTASTNMQLVSSGYLNMIQSDFQRDRISYLAWMRTFI